MPCARLRPLCAYGKTHALPGQGNASLSRVDARRRHSTHGCLIGRCCNFAHVLLP